MKDYKQWLVERFIIERKRFDRSGVYAYTQRAMAYNSNKIEGSTLTPEQTASLFDNGTLPQSDDYYRAKDVEEMNGHFLMFNYMLDTLDEELTPELIKHLHYELKTGVFEDRANGYAIGDYKKRPNMVGMYRTTLPQDVETEMNQLLKWYREQNKNMETLAEFHARYEAIRILTFVLRYVTIALEAHASHLTLRKEVRKWENLIIWGKSLICKDSSVTLNPKLSMLPEKKQAKKSSM